MSAVSIRGGLLSPAFARAVLPTLAAVSLPPPEAIRELEQVGNTADTAVGPASSARAIADLLMLPLARVLRLRVLRRRDAPDHVRMDLGGSGPSTIPVVVRAWSDELDSSWRELVHQGIAADARWCMVMNGRVIRIVDSQRTWSRRYLELDVPALDHDADVRNVAWMIASDQALTAIPAVLDTAARLSAAHGVDVSRCLGDGVVKALALLFETLRRGGAQGLTATLLLEQCLTVVYRVLFLLFAEARGLVPIWHPIYRDQYTIASIITRTGDGHPPRGLWRALQAIARMAHAGCSTGTLSVTAFNGRLFAPSHTAFIDRRPIEDRVIGDVVLGLGTTVIAGAGRVRTRYDELDVEQLGAVYEHVLEFQPDSQREALVYTRDTRKATATFYTPREIAASLVRRTLEPLVKGRTAKQILDLRILDPAMGSGAFLVAACRFLADRLEAALIAEGTWHTGEATESDRTMLKREIVQRCLYGVDSNPIAAQLARLSLWLVALAHDKPLSFLDHHLIVGNSLVGASPPDVYRPAHTTERRRRVTELPLFVEEQLESTLATASRLREALAAEPDDTAAVVRSKERRLAALASRDEPLSAWRRALDLWCTTWFWDDPQAPARTVIADLTSRLLCGRSSLSESTAAPILAAAAQCAERERFLHWSLAFPEVFAARDAAAAGFDAVVGNPPWDMIRGDSGDPPTRASRRAAARNLTRFARDSGIYRGDAKVHLNRYALFVERALQLVRHHGRIGMILPAGLLTDAGTAPLRRRLLTSTSVEDVIGFDNKRAIFPIHRSVKFILLSATAGQATDAIRCRFGLSQLEHLEAAYPKPEPLVVTRSLLARVSGEDDLCLPELTSRTDLRILESISASVPTLGSGDGWRARFGRELNASDDRRFMVRQRPGAGRPVVEGKVLRPFGVALDTCQFALKPDAGRRIPYRPRLGYREIAGPTNRLTLIAAIIPAQAVTSHTVFCLKSPMPPAEQRVLCALLNSFVANYLVRMRVGTHLTASIMLRLRVPVVARGSALFERLLEISTTLMKEATDVEQSAVYHELQATAARLYGLGPDDFAHVLSTFPLVPASVRQACLAVFSSARTSESPAPDRRRPGGR